MLRALGRARLGVTLLLCLLAAGAIAPAAGAREPRITFHFGLERPERAARAAFWAVQAPSSASYRHFAPVGRFAARPSTIAAFKRRIARLGLSARIDRSGVFARVSGTPRRFESAFGARIAHSFNNDTDTHGYFPANRKGLPLPAALRPLVREVVPSFSLQERRPGAGAGASAASEFPPGPTNAGTWEDGCAAAQRTGAYSYAQVRHAYGADALAGSDAAVAIVNVGEGLEPADVRANERCFGYPRARLRTLLADGQREPLGRQTFEPAEDLALVRGMAPRLGALTFSQTWYAQELWFLAPAQVLAAPELPDTLSISYGECERLVRGPRHSPILRAGANLMDAVLVRLGLAGVGVFASAGDFGSTCNGQPYPGLAWPASSPFLTAVGGTRLVLDAANARVDEVVWNDTEWVAAEAGGGVGGGGRSFRPGQPPYQRSYPGIAPGSHRAAPDLAAHASIYPGWPVVLGESWTTDGGTSASAPLLAGAFAALSADLRKAGQPPLGPVNSLVYELRRSRPDAFFDVISGANGYDPAVAAHNAAPGYDLASGLGVPRFDRLAAAVPPPG